MVDMIESGWYSFTVCRTCSKRLSDSERRHNNGVCPKCGHKTEFSSTCNTTLIILKQTKHHPWWRFWNREVSYAGRDTFSQQWLNKNP